MSNEPTGGAVDNDFDDAARDPEALLEERLDAFPRTIEAGDVVIDVVTGRPLYVWRRSAPTAADYFDREDFDLTTYKAHPWLPVSAHDPIYECAFLPTKPEDIPGSKKSKTYDYPRGRLARVPVEWLFDEDVRPQENLKRACIAGLLATAESLEGDADTTADLVDAVHAVARAAYGDETVDDAIARSGVESRDDGGNADLEDF